jgi:hypothetical protein
MRLFYQRKKQSLQERKLALTRQIEQLKKGLDSTDKDSVQNVANALVSAHLAESTNTT